MLSIKDTKSKKGFRAYWFSWWLYTLGRFSLLFILNWLVFPIVLVFFIIFLCIKTLVWCFSLPFNVYVIVIFRICSLNYMIYCTLCFGALCVFLIDLVGSRTLSSRLKRSLGFEVLKNILTVVFILSHVLFAPNFGL